MTLNCRRHLVKQLSYSRGFENLPILPVRQSCRIVGRYWLNGISMRKQLLGSKKRYILSTFQKVCVVSNLDRLHHEGKTPAHKKAGGTAPNQLPDSPLKKLKLKHLSRYNTHSAQLQPSPLTLFCTNVQH